LPGARNDQLRIMTRFQQMADDSRSHHATVAGHIDSESVPRPHVVWYCQPYEVTRLICSV
jgi:hypothetical protein